ncbi:hypothetical protein M8C21_021538 [Ambrosia artemisiifolia]|uniref:Uncharacterized protein n=1 Tax=Ambrosia artemisiifolia TaxID=4212 RepID=A0AAD5CAJ1_AMBAR|nr:hypothetical protein M8C21_021538 [Ambrosia artemisiifolia]
MILEQYPPSIFLLTLIILIFTNFCVTYSQDSPSIYDILKLNGLPMGLFPKGVTNYSLDDNGRFQVHLDKACNTKFEDELHYDQSISGNLSFGRINEVSGISAKDLFLWFLVKEIWVDVPSSGLIYFDVGVVSKQFSLSSFETPRACVASSVPKILSRKLGRDEPKHQELSRAIL